MIRTHAAGTLRSSDAGTTVTLAGWIASRRDHGGVVFLDVRDYSGVVQVVVRGDDLVHDLRDEWCVAITGEVRERVDGKLNPALATGDIEVVAEVLDVLNPSAPLPFPIDDQVDGWRGDPAAVSLP